ncbi:MAG: beta-ketoacyl-ACP synthase II [Chloroflexaceae bacterium]
MPGGVDPTRRVVVTGLGAVTPLGNTVASFWANLCAGRSGVGRISLFDAAAFRTQIAAEVRDLELPPNISAKQARRMDRFALFALVAALEAWQHAGLSSITVDPYEVGVLIGSSHGGEHALMAEIDTIMHGDLRRVSPRLIPRLLSNMAAVQVGIHLGLRGPSFTLGSACATGAHSIGEAAEIIRRGDATLMLCGGAEACITPLTVAGDQAAGALSCHNANPDQASRPFDADRDGFVLGEGAGVLVLEAYAHARQRGAPIYAELGAYATTADALHETHPDATGTHAARAITRALGKADLAPRNIDAVFAHATSTRVGDRAEVQALLQALGDTAHQVPVTAIKAAMGHPLAAAGALQAVAVIQALQTQMLPPIINLEQPDPECRLTFVVNAAQPTPLTHILSNSFGFGGHNVALIFSRAG